MRSFCATFECLCQLQLEKNVTVLSQVVPALERSGFLFGLLRFRTLVPALTRGVGILTICDYL